MLQVLRTGGRLVSVSHSSRASLMQVALLVQKYLLTSTKVQILTQLCCGIGLAVYDDLKVHSVEG